MTKQREGHNIRALGDWDYVYMCTVKHSEAIPFKKYFYGMENYKECEIFKKQGKKLYT